MATLTLLLISLWMGVAAEGCPAGCICSSAVTDCSRAGLRNLPWDIAPQTETLFLSDNQLTSILKGAFRNLTALTFLGLSRNKICPENDTLESLINLLSLDVSENDLQSMPIVPSGVAGVGLEQSLSNVSVMAARWQTFVGGLLLLLSRKLGWVEISSFSCSSAVLFRAGKGLCFLKHMSVNRSAAFAWLPGSVLFVGNIYAGSRALSRLPIPVFFTLHNASEVVTCIVRKLTQREELGDDFPGLSGPMTCSNWVILGALKQGEDDGAQLSGQFSKKAEINDCVLHEDCYSDIVALLGFFLLLVTVRLKSHLSLEHCGTWVFLAKVPWTPQGALFGQEGSKVQVIETMQREASRCTVLGTRVRVWRMECRLPSGGQGGASGWLWLKRGKTAEGGAMGEGEQRACARRCGPGERREGGGPAASLLQSSDP
ncbi:TM241 protein, partial [Atractosteus spatula]|nr:TM241 protein [Atractosteus spatula]